MLNIKILHSILLAGFVLLLTGCFGGGGGSSQETNIVVQPNVSQLNIIVNNNQQVANDSSSISLTIEARDKAYVPLADVPVELSGSSSTALLSILSGKTNAQGRLAVSVSNRVAEVVTITAKAGKLQSSATLSFIAPVSDIELYTQDRLSILPVSQKADIKVITYQTVQSDAGTGNNTSHRQRLPNVPFSVSLTGKATTSIDAGTTDANGEANFTVGSESGDNVTVTVTSKLMTKSLALYFGAHLQLLPTQVDAVDTATLTALLKDVYHVPLSNQTIYFNLNGDKDETFSPSFITTDQQGMAAVKVVDVAKDGGKITVQASTNQLFATDALAAQAQVNFRTVFANNRQLKLETPVSVLNTGQSATIIASITETNGLPVKGQAVKFYVSNQEGTGTSGKLSTDSGISDEQGRVQTTVSSSEKANIVVTAQADTAKQTVLLHFGANLSLTPSTTNGVAGGSLPITLIATVRDAHNLGIAGVPVDFRISKGVGLLDNFRVVTDNSGHAKISVNSAQTGDSQVQAQAALLSPASVSLNFVPNNPATLLLTATPTTISLNQTATITAQVQDKQGNPVKDGTLVQFKTSDIGKITSTAYTKGGTASAIFNASIQAGTANIEVSSTNASANITLLIQPGGAGTIEVVNFKPDPPVIGIIGSGVAQVATIDFLVKDNLGNTVADGTPVYFELGNTLLGGGESISTEGVDGNTAKATTNKGVASVAVKSGAIAGNVDVIAKVNNISAVARVTIVGSLPDVDHFSLVAEYLNIAGGVVFGLQDKITVYVGDRFGNVVPDKTPVSFMTEGGIIGKSVGGGAFETTTQLGQATAILQSANPTTPSVGGVMALRTHGYQCSPPYLELGVDGVTSFQRDLCGNPGLVTVIAFTTGSESFLDFNANGLFDDNVDKLTALGFQDSNGNQRWDSGEIITNQGDMSEPYIDGNDNNTFDVGEFYVDVNNNNHFDGPDGRFQSNTLIWKDIRILFSGATQALTISPTTFSIPTGGLQSFTIESIGDVYGNALVAGSVLQVTARTGGVGLENELLGGTTNLEVLDTNGVAFKRLEFTLASNTVQLTKSVTLTIKITSPLKYQAPGGNGNIEAIIYGQINQ